MLTKDVSDIKEMLKGINVTLERMQNKMTGTHRDEQEGTHHGETSESNPGVETEVGKYRKLELSVFSGEDPLGWLFRVEQYFHVNSIAEHDKLEAAVVCLEGKALNWYQWLDTRTYLCKWVEFKKELLRCFHSSQPRGEYERLFIAKEDNAGICGRI